MTSADKHELGDELVNLVRTAYTNAPLGSKVSSLKDVIPSDWTVLDWDDEPGLDAAIFYRVARPKESWTGHKIQGIGHDGSRESKDKVIKKMESMLQKPGWWVESSDAMRSALLRTAAPPISNHRFLQHLFRDPTLVMLDDHTYSRQLENGHKITETVFGHPILNRTI